MEYFDYRKMFKKDFQYIGKLINESNMRVDTHPDEFNVINSVNPAVVESAKNTLNIHIDWFEEDIALFKLVDDIKNNYNWIDETTFEV